MSGQRPKVGQVKLENNNLDLSHVFLACSQQQQQQKLELNPKLELHSEGSTRLNWQDKWPLLIAPRSVALPDKDAFSFRFRAFFFFIHPSS